MQISEEDYRTLKIQPGVQDVLYVTALVHNSLGEAEYGARDAAAKRHIEAGEEHARLESIPVTADWSELWDLTSEISTALASRN